MRDFKRGGSSDAFQRRLERLAVSINSAFPVPLRPSEVRGIAKSVARWTWKRFSDERFSDRQSVLGTRGAGKRWVGHVAAEETKPWVAQGISRRTWYRRRRAQDAQE